MNKNHLYYVFTNIESQPWKTLTGLADLFNSLIPPPSAGSSADLIPSPDPSADFISWSGSSVEELVFKDDFLDVYGKKWCLLG